MDMQSMLIAAIGALAGVIGIMWFTLQAKIAAAEKGCADDREKLWELVKVVSQLDRRQQTSLYADIIKPGSGGG